MKFNWGYGILFFFILFFIGMGAMYYLAARESNEMIDANYYEKELKYQEVIDASKNLLAITKSSLFSQNDTAILFSLPKAAFENFVQGNLELLRNENETLDYHTSIKPDTAGVFFISKKLLTSGLYKARLSWVAHATPFYKEESVWVKK